MHRNSCDHTVKSSPTFSNIAQPSFSSLECAYLEKLPPLGGEQGREWSRQMERRIGTSFSSSSPSLSLSPSCSNWLAWPGLGLALLLSRGCRPPASHHTRYNNAHGRERERELRRSCSFSALNCVIVFLSFSVSFRFW